MRVFLPLLVPDYTALALLGAAIAWTAAFALYLVVYLPWLTRSRVDGRDG
jgi:uncharacterized protein involved in response to NO